MPLPTSAVPLKGAIRRALQRALARAMRSPAVDRHRVVLELFSGKGDLSRAVRRAGRHSLPLDIVDNTLYDVLSAEAWSVKYGAGLLVVSYLQYGWVPLLYLVEGLARPPW